MPPVEGLPPIEIAPDPFAPVAPATSPPVSGGSGAPPASDPREVDLAERIKAVEEKLRQPFLFSSEERKLEAELKRLKDQLRALQEQTSALPRVHAWVTGDAALPFTASSKEFASSAFIARPQMNDSGAIDFRNLNAPPAVAAYQMDVATPITARLESYGRQRGNEWVYNQEPGRSRYLGGTSQGGFVLLPPEVGIEDSGVTFQPTDRGTLSKPYFTMGPGARLGFGPPDLTDGTVDNGWSMSNFLNSEVNLDPSSLLRGNDLCVWQHASAASPAFAFFSDSQSLATLKENFGWKSNTDFWGVFDHTNTANRLYTFPDADTTIHGGSGTANRLAYWSAATTLAANAAITSTHVLYADASGLPQGSANLTFDNITLTVAQSLRVGTASEVLAQGDAVFGLTTADRIFYDQSTNILEQFETSTDDPVYRFTISGGNSYALGIDNSDSDKFKVSYGSAGNAVLGTNDYLVIVTDGSSATFNGQVLGGTGSATAPTFAPSTDPDTGWYSPSAGSNFLALSNGTTPVVNVGPSQFRVISTYAVGFASGDPVSNALDTYLERAGAGIFKLTNQLRIGTATDTATSGDFATGLTAAARLVYDQSAESLSFYDASGNLDGLIVAGSESYLVGNLVVGSTSTLLGEKLRVHQDGSDDTVLLLTRDATNDDINEDTLMDRVTTTDATVTTLQTIPLTASRTYTIESRVYARRTGGTAGTAEDGAGYVIRSTWNTIGGVTTIIGAVNADYTAENQAAWDATHASDGAGNVLLRVTGAANNNVTWHHVTRVSYVGS